MDGELLAEYEEVRASGQANMFDRQRVAVVAEGLGLYRLVVVASDREEYGRLLEAVSQRGREKSGLDRD